MVFGHGFNSRRLHQTEKEVPRAPLFSVCRSLGIDPLAQTQTPKTPQNSKICIYKKRRTNTRIGDKSLTRRFRVGSLAGRGRFPSAPPKNLVFQNEIFLSIAKAMAYHHALACISSALTRISRQSEYIINRRLYILSQ